MENAPYKSGDRTEYHSTSHKNAIIEQFNIPCNMPSLTDIGTLITTTPGVCGGRPCIAESRITVQYIITEIKAGSTPEEIIEDKPFLSLASIHAVIAYYYANKAVLDALFSAQAEEDTQWEQRLAQSE